MSMKKKSVSALILVFMLVFVVIGTQVCAIEITPRWKIISQCVTTLKVSGNTGTINFSVVLNRVDYGIDANVCLQQMKNNKWTEIDSWDVSDEGLCRLSATKFLIIELNLLLLLQTQMENKSKKLQNILTPITYHKNIKSPWSLFFYIL